MKLHGTKKERVTAVAKQRENAAIKPQKKNLAKDHGAKRGDIAEWLSSVNSDASHIQQHISGLDALDRLIFKNSTKKSFAKSLPVVLLSKQVTRKRSSSAGRALPKKF